MNSPFSALSSPTINPNPKRRAPPEKSRPRAPGPPSGKSIPKESNYSSPDLRSREEREAEHEQLFWSGGKPPRISDSSDSLLDEQLDMTGMDALMSPPPAIPRSSRVSISSSPGTDADGSESDLSTHEANTDDETDGASESGEPTIVLSKLRHEPATAAPPAPPSPPLSRPHSQISVIEPQTPIQNHQAAAGTTAPPSTKTKVRRVHITADVERVCVSHMFPDSRNFTK